MRSGPRVDEKYGMSGSRANQEQMRSRREVDQKYVRRSVYIWFKIYLIENRSSVRANQEQMRSGSGYVGNLGGDFKWPTFLWQHRLFHPCKLIGSHCVFQSRHIFFSHSYPFAIWVTTCFQGKKNGSQFVKHTNFLLSNQFLLTCWHCANVSLSGEG